MFLCDFQIISSSLTRYGKPGPVSPVELPDLLQPEVLPEVRRPRSEGDEHLRLLLWRFLLQQLCWVFPPRAWAQENLPEMQKYHQISE